MEKREKKARRKVNKANVIAIIISFVAILGIIALACGVGGIIFLLNGKPDFNVSDFKSSESTIVYDRDDNQVYELGAVIRQNVEYDDLPESLIDAFVAVEDSRFFSHNGFDVPRFTKAIFENLKTLSFSQGGSTITMQLVKNTYFVDDEGGSGAVKSVKRKVQEIALALELNSKVSKKEVLVNYLNKLNFGGTSQNIRGVQKAAQYYFGKDVKDLTLPESAMLAGVVNAPYAYNPFNFLNNAQDRRDEVLYLMNHHGYITDEEYKLALATKVEDMLVDSSATTRGSGNGNSYQAYVDAVVDEVYNLTGLDPYTTPMRIYTYMDSDVQALMDNIEAGNVDDYFEYPDDEFEVASLCIDNDTGEIIGILGGRNYADGGSLLLNHAIDQYKQPGSSIKPILDYVQAFEVLGWSTSHTLMDEPLTYEGTDLIISNATNSYAGQVTLKYAVGMSLNTPAITTIRQLIKTKGYTYLTDYLQSMGFDIDIDDFDEQYAIGGKGLTVSCKQMAGAYAALMNGGYYTTPHTVKRIEFLSDKAPVTPTYTSTQTVSEQACFMMADVLRNNVEGGYPNLMGLFKNDNYTVYAKTGTTNWGSEATQFGVSVGAIKDGWVVGCTSDYSVATWMGYEKGQKGKPSSMSYDVYNKNIKGKITKLVLEKTAEIYGYADDVARPSGVSSITHILTTFPYAAPIDGMPEEYVTTGYIKSDSKYATLVSPKSVSIDEMSSNPSFTLSGTTLSIDWPTYPDEDKLEVVEDSITLSLLKTDGTVLLQTTGNRMFDYSWIYGAIKYKADIYVDGTIVKSVAESSSSNSYDLKKFLKTGSKVKACAFYGYENGGSSSQKCSETLTVNDTIEVTIDGGIDKDGAIKLLKNYIDASKIETVTVENDSMSEGTVSEIIIDGTTVYSGSRTKVELHALSLNNVKIKYYIKVNYSVILSKKLDENSKLVGFVASTAPTGYTGDYKFYVNGVKVQEGSDSTYLHVPTKTETIKVEIDGGKSDELQITVEE